MKPHLTHFQLEVWDDEIIVSLPGTNYAVTNYKPANSPQLLAKDFPYDDEAREPDGHMSALGHKRTLFTAPGCPLCSRKRTY